MIFSFLSIMPSSGKEIYIYRHLLIPHCQSDYEFRFPSSFFPLCILFFREQKAMTLFFVHISCLLLAFFCVYTCNLFIYLLHRIKEKKKFLLFFFECILFKTKKKPDVNEDIILNFYQLFFLF